MTRERNIGHCEHCKKEFGYYLIHNGFNNSSYAYCDACGTTALLDGYKVPEGIQISLHRNITPDMERHLAACKCGGSFKSGASPRCPHCNGALSADHAADYIEKQAAGTKGGWRWQRTWTGLYCIKIEGKEVRDIWV
jgi:hypothetical protein